MQHIDMRFKDKNPKETVIHIQNILNNLGIEVCEKWNDSGIDNCNSVRLSAVKGIPKYNGKGVTPEFARASAYAEFIERLQAGIYLISYQSILRDPGMNLHAYAPDGKYMTVEELIENGEWMDYIIESYQEKAITRESLAELCRIFACADDGKILTVPFYSLFEKKYVYLPIAFVGRMYSANGNCAGNTREEAWVHALSEMMERYATQKMMVSGLAAPRIPEDILNRFPTVSKILQKIRETGRYEIGVFDYSIGNGFPVVSTRIIDKANQNYHINVAADPVLEIAVQRTLTELFQNRRIDNLSSRHNGRILNKNSDFPIRINLKNQLQTSDGIYTADFFADEITCDRVSAEFPDNSKKSNKELLGYMLGLYKKLGKPIYVRNYSYLGFCSYKFVVPGFSETDACSLGEPIPEYSLGDSVYNVFRNPIDSTDDDLRWLLKFSDMIKNIYGRYNSYSVNSGIPIAGESNNLLCGLIRAYAAYRIKDYKSAIHYTNALTKKDEMFSAYFTCVNKYLEMKLANIAEEKIEIILYKFFEKHYVDALYDKLNKGMSPYDDYLIQCDLESCAKCRYEKACCYNELKALTAKVGSVYKTFFDGQDPSEFAIE